jgi:hypothetical protein
MQAKTDEVSRQDAIAAIEKRSSDSATEIAGEGYRKIYKDDGVIALTEIVNQYYKTTKHSNKADHKTWENLFVEQSINLFAGARGQLYFHHKQHSIPLISVEVFDKLWNTLSTNILDRIGTEYYDKYCNAPGFGDQYTKSFDVARKSVENRPDSPRLIAADHPRISETTRYYVAK